MTKAKFADFQKWPLLVVFNFDVSFTIPTQKSVQYKYSLFTRLPKRDIDGGFKLALKYTTANTAKIIPPTTKLLIQYFEVG